MMDEIVRDIVNDVITVINVAPPPENEVDVSQEVKEMFDPYKQMLLAAVWIQLGMENWFSWLNKILNVD